MQIIRDDDAALIVRNPEAGRNKLSLLKHIYVEWGSKADWDALCELHYKGHTLAAGSRFMRCMLREPGKPAQQIGVMVFANPRPLDAGRNEVFPHLKPNVNGRDNRLINQARMRWINTSLTWNNRTVLDTMYRSAGIAYRFKNIAYRMYCARYGYKAVESRSSMGRFNPFSIKAGMRFVKPKPTPALEEGLRFFAANFAADPSDIVAIMQELQASPHREFLEKKLRGFYYKWSSVEKSGDKRALGMSRVNELPIDYVLRQIMQLVFSATVYWVWLAVDKPGTLPAVMPLLAFDEQGPREALARDWSHWSPAWLHDAQNGASERAIDAGEGETHVNEMEALQRALEGC